ncbi:39S ribosomal protein L23, mitochondrial [Dendroctonus ponderosae]
MSTRWYPLYQQGGPQLRVFLPNFWMKLVRPTGEHPPNLVQFSCSMQMTKFDIKSYLEKIYNVKTVDVRTRIALGKTRKDPGKGYVVKDDDIKYAYVTLEKGESFEFPDLFPGAEEKMDEYEKSLRASKEGFTKYVEKNKQRPGMPGWFSI